MGRFKAFDYAMRLKGGKLRKVTFLKYVGGGRSLIIDEKEDPCRVVVLTKNISKI